MAMKYLVKKESVHSVKDQIESQQETNITLCLTDINTSASTASGVTVYTSKKSTINNISASMMIKFISEGALNEIVGVSLSNKFAQDASTHSPATYVISSIIAAVGKGEKINIQRTSASIAPEVGKEERAILLNTAISSILIEELAPQHAWKEFESESLAATYHEIGAQFIKLEDFETALEILALSDRFEDSPRSLALRGLISKMKGETLDAVANMVSSLQQYEKRKAQEEPHYLIFRPQSFDIVNEVLKDGLDALNQRDNENALSHFAKAVFEFDGFYQQHGIDKKIN